MHPQARLGQDESTEAWIRSYVDVRGNSDLKTTTHTAIENLALNVDASV